MYESSFNLQRDEKKSYAQTKCCHQMHRYICSDGETFQAYTATGTREVRCCTRAVFNLQRDEKKSYAQTKFCNNREIYCSEKV
jgi:hypothetical protein